MNEMKKQVWIIEVHPESFRDYDADVARFLSLDPLAAEFPAWSAYNYVLGNPVMLVDPDGKAPEGDYYSSTGKYLFSDKKRDNKIHVHTSEGVFELPSFKDRGEIIGAVEGQYYDV